MSLGAIRRRAGKHLTSTISSSRIGSTANQVAAATGLRKCLPSEVFRSWMGSISILTYLVERNANLVPAPSTPLSKVHRPKTRSAPKISLRFLHTQRPIPVPGLNWHSRLGKEPFSLSQSSRSPSLRRAKSRYRLPPTQLNVALLHKLGGIAARFRTICFEAHTIRQDDQIIRDNPF
jgi:hypothetical protein